jgi:hypothetical protein
MPFAYVAANEIAARAKQQGQSRAHDAAIAV